MLEETADVVQRGLAQARVALFVPEEVASRPGRASGARACPEPAALYSGLGMKVATFPARSAAMRTMYLMSRPWSAARQQRRQQDLDLALARPASLVVVVLHRHPGSLDQRGHLRAEVVQPVVGREGVVAAVDRHAEDRQVGLVAVAAGVPGPLHRVDVVEGVVDVARVADGVEDVELVLRAPCAAWSAMPEARRYSSARAATERGSRRTGWPLRPSWIPQIMERVGASQNGSRKAGGRIGEEQHVARLGRGEPRDAGAVEADPLLEELGAEPGGRQGDVVPAAEEAAELQVDHHDFVPVGHLEDARHGIVHGGVLLVSEHALASPPHP